MTVQEIPRPAPAAPTVPRTVRVPAELWDAAGEIAAGEGLSVSEVVRHYLRAYVASAPTT